MWGRKFQKPKDTNAMMLAGTSFKAYRTEGWGSREGKRDLKEP